MLNLQNNNINSGGSSATPSAPASQPLQPLLIIYVPGFNLGGPTVNGPMWEEQMDQNIWSPSANSLGIPGISGSGYLASGGKQGQANSLPSPDFPVACIGMSGGADTCLLFAIDRLDKGVLTTHLVLIGGTFETSLRPSFQDWVADLKRLMDNGTKIVVVNDQSISGREHERFQYPGYIIGQVPFQQGMNSVLPHHTDTCRCGTAANNSQDLVNSVYQFIETGQWSWPYP
jgi:hypothetical protein